MADKAGVEIFKTFCEKVITDVSTKSSVSKARTTSRRVRRRKAKVRYHRRVRVLRKHKRKLKRINNKLFNNHRTNMDLTNLPTDIIKWNNKDELTFWKTKAMVLEMENQMLMLHLKHSYRQYIPVEGVPKASVERMEAVGRSTFPEPEQLKKCDQNELPNPLQQADPTEDRPIRDNTAEIRRTEMRELYGEKAEKIMGMETAVQLNFELNVKDGDVPYWPHLALNLNA